MSTTTVKFSGVPPRVQDGIEAEVVKSEHFRVVEDQPWVDNADMVVMYLGGCRSTLSRIAVAHQSDLRVFALLGDVAVLGYAEVLGVGATGVAYADLPPTTIVSLMWSAIGGETVLPATVAQRLGAGWSGSMPPDRLTEVELEVLRRLNKGQTVREVAVETDTAERTVRRHTQNAMLTLDCTSCHDTVQRASTRGLI